jgi:hypothetical protein
MIVTEYDAAARCDQLQLTNAFPTPNTQHRKPRNLLTMSLKGKAYLVGVDEHPFRKAPDNSAAQIHAKSAEDTLADTGLTIEDIGARCSDPTACAKTRVEPTDIRYAAIDDRVTITVLESIEDLGCCDKGKGSPFVANGNLIAGLAKGPSRNKVSNNEGAEAAAEWAIYFGWGP